MFQANVNCDEHAAKKYERKMKKLVSVQKLL